MSVAMSSTPPPASLTEASIPSGSATSAVLASSQSSTSKTKHRKKACKERAKVPNFRKPQAFVTVVVDNPPQNFVIHKDVLCYHSKFFANAFNGDFEEARTGTIHMEDVSGEAFGLLVHFLYTGKVEFEDSNADANVKDTGEGSTKKENGEENVVGVANTLVLADLWTLASVSLMKGLQNKVMELLWPMIQSMDDCDLNALVDRVYESNVGTTALKKAIVEKIAFGFGEKKLSAWMSPDGEKSLPDGLLVDVVMALKRLVVEEVVRSVSDYLV